MAVDKNYSTARKLDTNDAIIFGKNCTAGAAAAVISKTIIAPIERVKLILQVCLC